MASLRNIKERISSIQSTLKITSAMKMVSSAKLHKSQNIIGNMLLYADSLYSVMNRLLSDDFSCTLSEERPVRRVAIVVFSSDSTLCGAFNANVIRELKKTLDSYHGHSEVDLYTIGKKVFEVTKKWEQPVTQNFEKLSEKPDYKLIANLAETFIQQFEKGMIDRVEVIYHHFKSVGTQILMHENLLPLALSSPKEESLSSTNYLYEPSPENLLEVLIPKSFKLELYTALLDSNASEHAARMISMQTATDNADRMITDLTKEYNKSRQQTITNELLDIIGGSMNR